MNKQIGFRGWKTAVKFAQCLEEEVCGVILDSICIRRESYVDRGHIVGVSYVVYWTEEFQTFVKEGK